MDSVPAQALLLALTSLASYRIWRLVGFDNISEAIRDYVDERAGRNLAAAWAYELLVCPWCLGTWTALAVTAAVDAAGVSVWAPWLHAAAAAVFVGWVHALIVSRET